MKNLNFKIIIYIATLAFGLRSWALDPNKNYAEMSSDHFTIIFDADRYELAKTYLNEAERSYQILTKVFSEAPEKTIIILDDTTDIANGSATGVPRPTINAITSLPTPLDTIDHYSFWPRDLLTHEYTHILNMEPTHGVFKPLRSVFGSIIRPNMYLPRWYLEGLAVEMESRWDETGRLKTTDYDALIRAIYLGNKWGDDNLSAIGNSDTPSWPQGQRPYFYGALLWHDLIQTKGIKIVEDLNQRYSERFPYFLSQPIIEQIQKTYQDFLGDMYEHYAHLAAKQVQKIKTKKTTDGEIINIPGAVFAHSPVISPDGQKLAAVSGQEGANSLIVIYERDPQTNSFEPFAENKKSFKNISDLDKDFPNRVSWFPDSQRVVFDGADMFEHYYYTYDLYVWDLKKDCIEPLTVGKRAREPHVSPDGSKIIFVQGDGVNTTLALMDSDGKNIQTVYTPPALIRVSHPTFINEHEIVFAQKDNHGFEHLHVLDLQSKQITRTLDGFKDARQPNVTSDGIIFTSIDSGVENLYLTSFDFKKTKILSNSLSRMLNGTLDTAHHQMIYSEMTATGAQIKRAPAQNIDTLPQVEQMMANDFPKNIVQDAPTVNAEKKNYHPIDYMFPQFWLPDVEFVPGGVVPNITVPGSDALGFHQYALQALYDSRDHKYDGLLTYGWDNPLALSILTTGEYHTYFLGLNDFTATRTIRLLNESYFLPNNDHWYAILGYEYDENGVLETSATSPKRNYYTSQPTLGIGWGHMKQVLTDISPHGDNAELTYSYIFNRTLRKNYDQIYFDFNHYQSQFLPDRQVLALTVQAIYTPNDHRNIFLSTTTSESDFSFGPTQDQFVMRGYPWGEFLGYSMVTGSLEYRFPVMDIYNGPNEPTPIFLKKLYGDIFTDSLTVNGVYFDQNGSARLAQFGHYFFSSGLEAKIDMNLLYQLPITFKVVLAYGYSHEAQGGYSIYGAITTPELLNF